MSLRPVSRVLAANIRDARNDLGWTQDDLAMRMVHAGFTNWSRATVAQSEALSRPPADQGRVRRITIEEVIGLAWVLDCSVFELLAIEEPVQIAEALVLESDEYLALLYRAPEHRDNREEALMAEIARQQRWQRELADSTIATKVLLEDLESRLADIRRQGDS